jgi:alanine racemase
MDAPRVWAEVDLDAIAANLSLIRSRIPPYTRVLAVLKADAYGHGAVRVARRLRQEGVDMIGVGDSSEAIELRQAGVEGDILILGAVIASEAARVIRHDISVSVHSFDRVRLLEKAARAMGRRLRVHLKIDTGMGRLGVSPSVARELARRIHSSAHLSLEGICTHLSCADEPDGRFSGEQVRRFRRVLMEIRELDRIDPEYVHAANSAAIFHGADGQSPCFDLIRCGIALHGINPGFRGADELRPALSLRTQVIFLKDHAEDTPIGYGRTHRTGRPSRIATLPIGYNDGYPYALAGRAEVLVRGRRAPVVGRISMDYATVDVTDIPDVVVGDRVTLVGRDGDDEILMTDVARWAGTIPYEIPCRFGRRVARLYRPEEPFPGGPEEEPLEAPEEVPAVARP